MLTPMPSRGHLHCARRCRRPVEAPRQRHSIRDLPFWVRLLASSHRRLHVGGLLVSSSPSQAKPNQSRPNPKVDPQVKLADTPSLTSLIKRGNIFVPDLYNGESSSRYWFVRGWNPRSVVVTILALVPCLPSFAATIAPDHLNLPLGAQRMFYLSFTVTYALAAIMYYVSYLVWPEKAAAKKELGMRFEQQADEDDEEERRAIRLRAAEDGDGVDEGDVVEGKEYEVDGAKTAVMLSP
jgi:hypothetical protein